MWTSSSCSSRLNPMGAPITTDPTDDRPLDLGDIRGYVPDDEVAEPQTPPAGSAGVSPKEPSDQTE